MNLTKLFNKNYLFENIKKSKGVLILFLILVPVFTCITLVLRATTDTFLVLSFIEISIINIIGMYVIPIVLSNILFGYVYKRQSVDFINSMPIDRKSIFVTNTIGGIALILLMQIITLILLFVCDAFSASIVIFSGIIIDSFLVMTVSYIFVFLSTNIAMSISGNNLTQIAVTMLILFLIPFCIDVCIGFESIYSTYDYVHLEAMETQIPITTIESINYTTPYRLFSMIFRGGYASGNEFYNLNSILRMIVLSAIYFVLGNKLFEKRKMEETEESFANVRTHLVVKGLTIVPMLVLINAIGGEFVFNVFAISLITVYYFIYDLITRKKVKFLQSVMCLIASLVIIQVAYIGTKEYRENKSQNNLFKSDISSIAFNLNDIQNTYMYSSFNTLSNYGIDISKDISNYYMDNKELISIIFDSVAYNQGEAVEIKAYDYIYNDATYRLPVNIKTSDGKIAKTSVSISKGKIDAIIDILEKDEQYVRLVKNISAYNSIIKIGNKKADNETEIKLKQEIIDSIENMTLKEFVTKVVISEMESINLINYKNHNLITIRIPLNLSEEVFKITTNILNNDAKERLKRSLNDGEYYSVYINEIERNYEKYPEYSNKIYYAREGLVDFILNSQNTEFNSNDNYFTINGYAYNTSFVYITNLTKEVLEIIDAAEYNDEYIMNEKYNQIYNGYTQTEEEPEIVLNNAEDMIVNEMTVEEVDN